MLATAAAAAAAGTWRIDMQCAFLGPTYSYALLFLLTYITHSRKAPKSSNVCQATI